MLTSGMISKSVIEWLKSEASSDAAQSLDVICIANNLNLGTLAPGYNKGFQSKDSHVGEAEYLKLSNKGGMHTLGGKIDFDDHGKLRVGRLRERDKLGLLNL